MRKEWTAPKRNYDKVEYEYIRKELEFDYTDFHDALSKIYYENKWNNEDVEFIYNNVNYGLLTEDKFTELHSLNHFEMELIINTEISNVYNYVNRISEEKPEYLTEEQCQKTITKVTEEKISEINTRINDINIKLQEADIKGVSISRVVK